MLAELEAVATAQGSFAFEYDPEAPILRVPGRILKFYMVRPAVLCAPRAVRPTGGVLAWCVPMTACNQQPHRCRSAP